MSEFVMTDELCKKANEKTTLNIMLITDGDSRLSLLRGESALKSFIRFYERVVNISYHVAPSSKLGTITEAELEGINVLWLDNISDFKAAMNFSQITDRMLSSIDPEWRATAIEYSKTDKEKGEEFIKSIIKKRQDKIRIIYSLDEFIWEAPLGRSKEVKRVQVMESMMDIADTIIVPNADLRDFILPNAEASWGGFVRENKDVMVIPTALSPDFFPLYKNFKRGGRGTQIHDKPKVLVKGSMIPDNVQEFIIENYRKMEITICSIGEVNEHLMGLLSQKKVSHIMHWAHPHVNRRNMLDTMAIERDSGFDVVIHTMPSNLNGELYELTLGDDDVLFTIGHGAIPICGVEHVGYSEGHLSLQSGYVFGPDAPAKYLRNVINALIDAPVKFNDTFNKCKARVENRVSASPSIMGLYFTAMIGQELAEARQVLVDEARARIKASEESEESDNTESDNTEIDTETENKIIQFPTKEG